MISFAWLRLNMRVTVALAPRKAVDAAARPFTTPPRFSHTPRELELLSTGSRYELRTPQGRLAAWRFGRGDHHAVVLCHGWGGRGAQLRVFVPALLEAGYQVVLLDHAGHGLSEGREATLVHFDREVAPSSGLALARAWPGARFLGTRGLGHRSVLRDPAVVQDAVDFLADRVMFAPPPGRSEARAYAAPAPLI